MKYLVGLGNPGAKYSGTAHNLGFDVADVLARRWNLDWRLQERVRAQLAEGRIAGEPALLVKPLTFMNLSGESLGLLLRQREVSGEEILVVTDDVALPVGKLRLRGDGSHGGHNGLRSVIERLGHDRFARLRVGIWTPDAEGTDLADYVLRKLPPKTREQLAEMAELAADAAESWLREGMTAASDRYNGTRRFDPPKGKENA